MINKKTIIALVLITIFLNCIPRNVKAQTQPDVFVGVHLGYGDVAEAKALIDRTASCANFVLIGTSRIFYNQLKEGVFISKSIDIFPDSIFDKSRISLIRLRSEFPEL